MNTEKTKDVSELESATERAIDNLFAVGRLWARHGLDVGKAALTTAAQTLEVTAETLGNLSDRIGHRDDEGDAR